MSIYVEIHIRAPIDDVWAKTQTPAEHQRWDLRFTRIEYLPRPDESQPQQFLYATRIGFGLEVRGEGESTGKLQAGGERSSSLRFWSSDPKSLIREGSGYWKYIPTANGILFLTWYDYETRFGWAGQMFDAVAFRPLLGWATAWSFDRLRLWLERGVAPEMAFRNSVVHAIARTTLAAVWLYQGLVPKLLLRNVDEVAMVLAAGIARTRAQTTVGGLGILEVAFGLVVITAWRTRAVFLVNIVLMIVAVVAVAIASPQYLTAAFNPVAFNLAVAALAAIGYLVSADLPTARTCSRKPGTQS